GLAAAGLAGQAERLAAAQLEAHAVDNRDDAAILAVGHPEVAHVQERVAPDRRRAHARSRREGLTISSRAYPTRLKAMASSVTHRPGGMKYAQSPSVMAPE